MTLLQNSINKAFPLSTVDGGTGQDLSGMQDGQLLIGNGNQAYPSVSYLTPSAGININNTPGQIAIGNPAYFPTGLPPIVQLIPNLSLIMTWDRGSGANIIFPSGFDFNVQLGDKFYIAGEIGSNGLHIRKAYFDQKIVFNGSLVDSITTTYPTACITFMCTDATSMAQHFSIFSTNEATFTTP